MASFNGPATDSYGQTVPGGREERRRQQRGGEEDSRQQRMPAAVEAVLLFGHPPDLVLSTYQRLQSAHDTDSQHAASGSGDAAMTGNAQPEAAVSAAALLEAVEDICQCQRLSGVSPSGSVEAGRGVVASSAPELDAASRGGAAEEDMVNRGQHGGDGTEEWMTSSSQLHRGPQQSSSHTTQDWTPSSTHTQSFLNSSTQSHINTHASITEQYSSRNHSSIINTLGAVSSIDSSHMSASSENAESASSLTSLGNPESASPLTPSENPETVSSVTSSENPETTSSMTSACAVSSAVESSLGSTALTTSLPTTTFVTASHCTDSEMKSPAAETAAARATAAAFPNTAIDSNPRSRPSPTLRDRSGDRNGEEQEAVREERARERQRQLSRLRALREENRRLKARRTCRHCRENPVALTLLPCGHFCLCQDCGPLVDECPVCRKTILADVRTFVS